MKLDNWWNIHPFEDPRFEGLLGISFAVSDALDLASGHFNNGEAEHNLEIYKIRTPLELAILMRKATDRIDELTLMPE